MDIEKLRADTPGCHEKIHFNNAGCSLTPQLIIDTIQDYLNREARIGGYELAAMMEDNINGFYTAVASLLNCRKENIAFATSATDAFAKALSSIPFSSGDTILTTENDYVSNQIQFLSLQKRFGIEIIRAENTASGEADLTSVSDNIKKHHPKIVSVTHVPSSQGMIQPVEEIGNICREHDIIYFVDACQSAGQLELDVNKIHCDFLSATMRKFMRGPRGTGFLFISDKALQAGLEPLMIDMRGADWTDDNKYQPLPDGRRFEFVEISYALLLGAARAVNYALDIGPKNIAERNAMLCSYARQKLQALPLQLMDRGSKLSSIITAHSDKIPVAVLKEELHKRNINTSMATTKFARLDLNYKNVDAILRISPHYYNTAEEMDVLTAAIDEILKS